MGQPAAKQGVNRPVRARHAPQLRLRRRIGTTLDLQTNAPNTAILLEYSTGKTHTKCQQGQGRAAPLGANNNPLFEDATREGYARAHNSTKRKKNSSLQFQSTSYKPNTAKPITAKKKKETYAPHLTDPTPTTPTFIKFSSPPNHSSFLRSHLYLQTPSIHGFKHINKYISASAPPRPTTRNAVFLDNRQTTLTTPPPRHRREKGQSVQASEADNAPKRPESPQPLGGRPTKQHSTLAIFPIQKR